MDLKPILGDWERIANTNSLYNTLKILGALYKSGNITPKQSEVFRAFRMCPYNNLSIVIIGQDPYPQSGIATGLAFGNTISTHMDKLSPSLKVLKEAVINFENPHNCITFDNSLESWAKQGVLLLNSSLTVEINKPGSHTTLWKDFIGELLVNLSKYNSGIIYVLLGKQAQSFKKYINGRTNYIFEDNHPAYYARLGTKMSSTIFEEVNNILLKNKNLKINWYEEQ